MNTGLKVITGLIVVGAVVALGVVIASYTQVDQSESAVIVRVGKVDRVLTAGYYWINPFLEDAHFFSTRQQAYATKAAAASSDLQNVEAEITVNYSLNAESVTQLYVTFNRDLEAKVLQPSLQDSIKAATAKYTAEQLITKREDVRGEIKRVLNESVNNKAPGIATIIDVSITNFTFSSGFDRAIEAKVNAEQEALKAKNELERVKFEAAQSIAKAQAEAQSIRLQSDAANNPRFVELKQLEVQLEFAKKWDGRLPQNLYGSAPIPFLQLGN